MLVHGRLKGRLTDVLGIRAYVDTKPGTTSNFMMNGFVVGVIVGVVVGAAGRGVIHHYQ